MKKIKTFCVILIIILGAAQAFSSDQQSLQRYGLFIGSNSGGNDRHNLLYANSDARAMLRVMTELGGIDRANSILLEDPDKQSIEDAFETLLQTIENNRPTSRRSEFILYYSGHSDEEGLLLGDQYYSYTRIRQNLQAMNTDVHIAILDGCHSGAFTRSKGGIRRAPFLVDESSNTRGYAYLTASSANEAAQESDAIEGSFFTHYLLAALRGAADSTGMDRRITLSEAYSYASAETLARTEHTLAGPQHAMYDMNLTGSGELILTDLRNTDAVLELKADINGRLYIRDTNRRLAAEINATGGRSAIIALSPGYYSVSLHNGTDILSTDFILRRGRNTTLAYQDFQSVQREITRIRGDAADSLDSNFEEEVRNDALRALEALIQRRTPNQNTSTQAKPDTNREYPDIELLHRHNSIGLISGDINNSHRVVTHNFSIHLINSSYRSHGLELGLLNIVEDSISGIQMAPFFNLAGGRLKGLQSAGIFNLCDSDLNGVQSGGVFNLVNGNSDALQFAGVFNITGGSVKGLQSAGVFNMANKEVRGFQAAGIFNMSEETMYGGQAAGIFNSAAHVKGVQLSLVNYSRQTSGIQAGLVNIGGATSGVQFGLINIAGTMDGLAFGLVNIAQNGLNHSTAWFDDSDYLYSGYMLGSRPLYTIVYFGGSQTGFEDKPLVSGLGMGVQLERRSLFVNVDLTAKHVSRGQGNTEKLTGLFNYRHDTVFPYLRAMGGVKIGKKLALFGGMGIDVHLPGITEKQPEFHTGSFESFKYSSDHDPAELYTKWFVGLRF